MHSAFSKLFEKARSSGFFRWLLNFLLLRKIPFNKAHKPRISLITDDAVEVVLPFRRSNFNHLGGMHACALAMVGEMAAGLRLQSALNSGSYRLIMKTMSVEYVHQGRSDVIARCELSALQIAQQVLQPLANADSVMIDLDTIVRDPNGRHICTVKTTWQIKSWSKVKVKG
jgi:acyl-coenzyme A thioesterase PaaI-like protein